MSHKYSISVIMPVFNEPIKEIRSSIKSILNQTYNYFDLIIIDDNPEYIKLRHYLNVINYLNNRVKILFNKRCIGAALSRNKGIHYSNSDLIAIMDADDISNYNRLLYQFKFMKKFDLDFVFSNCKDFDYNSVNNKAILGGNKIISQNILRYIFSHYYDCAIHSGWLVKRQVYINLNGYRHLRDGEDYDFLLRALVNKYLIGYQPQILIFKRQRQNSVSTKNQLKQFKISLILKKYVRKYDYTRIIPLDVIYKLQNRISLMSINKFNKFLQLGHFVKYNFKLIYFIKFISIIVTSLSSIEYLFNLIMKHIYRRKIYNLISRNNNC